MNRMAQRTIHLVLCLAVAIGALLITSLPTPGQDPEAVPEGQAERERRESQVRPYATLVRRQGRFLRNLESRSQLHLRYFRFPQAW